MWAPPSTHPPRERAVLPGVGARDRWEEEPGVYTILKAAFWFGRGEARSAGPTPYLGGEWEQQQQRAGGRRHRAQRVLLQPQHVHKAPLAGDPQPGQHLRRGDKAARLGEAGTPSAPIRAWEASPPGPPPRQGDDTAQSAAARGSGEARAPESRGPSHARGSSAGRSREGAASSSTCTPPRPRCRGRGRASRPRPARLLGSTQGAARSLRTRRSRWAPASASALLVGEGQRPRETPLTLFSI